LVNCPAGQASQNVPFSVPEKYPTGQISQTAHPEKLQNDPSGHPVHVVDPLLLLVEKPGEHKSQAVECVPA